MIKYESELDTVGLVDCQKLSDDFLSLCLFLYPPIWVLLPSVTFCNSPQLSALGRSPHLLAPIGPKRIVDARQLISHSVPYTVSKCPIFYIDFIFCYDDVVIAVGVGEY